MHFLPQPKAAEAQNRATVEAGWTDTLLPVPLVELGSSGGKPSGAQTHMMAKVCTWVMLAGDSNVRNIHQWDLFQRLNRTAAFKFQAHDFSKPPANAQHCKDGLHPITKNGVCDARWARDYHELMLNSARFPLTFARAIC